MNRIVVLLESRGGKGMFKKKVSKLVSSAVLLESASVLGLQAQGGVTGEQLKPFVGDLPLKGLASNKSTKVLKSSNFLLPLVKIFGVTLLLGAVYCLLCNIERKWAVKKYDSLIDDVNKNEAKMNDDIKNNMSSISSDKYKDELDADFDAKIKKYEEKILKYKEEKDELEKELTVLEKNSKIYQPLKEIDDEIDRLDDAHHCLNIQYQIDQEKNNIKKNEAELSTLCKEMGPGVKPEDFYESTGHYIRYKNDNEKKAHELVCELRSSKKNIERLTKQLNTFRGFSAERIREKINKLNKKKNEDGKISKITKDCITDLREVLAEKEKEFKVLSENEYKEKVKKLLEKVDGLPSIDDDKFEKAKQNLQEKLNNILKSEKNMGDVCNGFESLKTESTDFGVDKKLITGIKRQLMRFSKNNIGNVRREILSRNSSIKEFENLLESCKKRKEGANLLREKVEHLNKMRKEVENNKLMKAQLQEKRNKIASRAWYKLHCLGGYYSNVPSLED